MPKPVLKPCPFCTGEADMGWNSDASVAFAYCLTCAAEGPALGSILEAIENWNQAPRRRARKVAQDA